jgi:type II secretion system protein L
VSENRSVLVFGDDRLTWLSPGSPPRTLDDEVGLAALRAELARRDHRVVFAAPGGDIRLIETDVAPEERRHLESSLPFMLEESFTEDIETLHFARRLLRRDRCAVAVVARSTMDGWREALGEFASLVPWIPEPLLLPWQAGEWTVVFDGTGVLLRFADNGGTRIERSLLPVLLDGLANEGMPQRVVVYGDDEAGERACFREDLQSILNWRRGDFSAALRLAGDEARIDLRQGDYAPQLPYGRWWRQWRAVAVVAAVALGAHLLSGWLDIQRLERQNLALRSEIERVYREVNPRGAVVDAERQLERQLATLRGGSGGGSFTGLLSPLAMEMSAADGMQLASLNYSQGSRELRINLLAPDFGAVEGLRTALTQDGLEATLENSSRSGDRVRARLRIGGRS